MKNFWQTVKCLILTTSLFNTFKKRQKQKGLLIPTNVPFGLVEAMIRCLTARMRAEEEGHIFIGQWDGEINNGLGLQ